MQLPETKKAIKKFNRLARVLVEYELVFLQIWTKQIDAARVSLNATVLVRHPDTKELYVNFDKKVLELLRDIQVLQGMGIEMPTQGLLVYGQKNAILERYDAIRVMQLLDAVIVFTVIRENFVVKNFSFARSSDKSFFRENSFLY